MNAYEERQNWIDQLLDKALSDGFSGNKSINMLYAQIEDAQYAPNFWGDDEKRWSDWD